MINARMVASVVNIIVREGNSVYIQTGLMVKRFGGNNCWVNFIAVLRRARQKGGFAVVF
jgi:hypothetical protein